ncbi:MAG: UDP-N-acetylmuramoyl-L-alanyl-D-glutamate--2,6-diaminopimelate ligase [Neisseriaceae bacterium]
MNMYSSCNDKIDHNKISQLVEKLGYFIQKYNIEIDSRKADSLSIFCAYPGNKCDGRKFVPDVIRNGVKCLIQEGPFCLKLDNNYSIENLREYIGLLASYKYSNPSKHIKTIGVTGTNGKTSITQWLAQIYNSMNQKAAVIGTLGSGIYPLMADHASTTPDPVTIQKLFYDFVKENVYLAAMEVSSHGLDQGRLNGIQFETAIFTNLTQDHLDYHKTLENYYNAKRSLFYWHEIKRLIINTDDQYGRRLYNELKLSNSSAKIITYGINSGDVIAKDISISLNGTKFILEYNLELIEIKASVIGRFNVYNLLAVAAYLILDGFPLTDIAKYINIIKPISGRMDTIFKKGQPLVIVDFAHTPDALYNVLQSLRQIENRGKIICVFGCGGDRDRSKRPIMGEIVVKNSDYAIITSDNPRTEDPSSIIDEILRGVPMDASGFRVIVDRKKAIKYAISMAQENDIILIAGKGHEQYQEINGVRHYFSDFGEAKLALDNDF